MNDLIGRTLSGRYRIDAFLGRGGMSEVYKVWDSQRSVYLAMKLLREDLAEDQVFLKRFQREAQTLARLQHPNIVRLYGLEREGPLAFMLMDFVDGITLRRQILDNKGPMPLERVLAILRPVCAALHYAHSQGLVHCDVKPGNIMIDRTGRILLTDFGIARVAESTTATMVGLGTPAYMAPELIRGQDPSPQTDIYALGVVLYEMLTGGERPFTGEKATITGSTSEKVRWEQLNLAPADLRSRNRDIPAEVEATVLWCLAKDPAGRPATVNQLLANLERATYPAPAVPPEKKGKEPIPEPHAAEPLPPPFEPVALEAHAAPESPQPDRPAGAQPLYPAPAASPPGESPPAAGSSPLRPDEVARRKILIGSRHAVLWVAASTLALLFANEVVPYILDELDYYSRALEFGITGFVLGIAQWLVLYGKVSGSGWWPFATSLGWICMAWLGGVEFSSPTMQAIFAGLALGFVQWLLFWKGIEGTGWWLVVTAVGMVITLHNMGAFGNPFFGADVLAGVASGYFLAKETVRERP